MRLSDVRHQEAAHDRLQRAFRASRVPHAYLLTGPHGIGKEMLATRLAALLLCEQPVEVPPPGEVTANAAPWQDACGRCVDCELMAAGTHPDLHRIHRELTKFHPKKGIRDRSKAIDLSVDVIRHFLIGPAGLSPSRGRAKVFLIAEGERLSAGAQNAMLKTLEEPPERSYIILLAAAADTLLATTRSRCHHVAMRTLPTAFIREHLIEQHGVSPQAATFLAEMSEGSVGAAIRFLQHDLYAAVPALVELLGRSAADPLGCGATLLEAGLEMAKASAKLTQADEQPAGGNAQESAGDDADEADAEEDSEDAETPSKGAGDVNTRRLAQEMLLAAVSTILRDVQRTLVGHEVAALPGVARIGELAARTTTEGVRSAIQAVSTAEYHIRRSVNAKLVFDGLGIGLGIGLSKARTEG